MMKRISDQISSCSKLYFISILMSIWFTPLMAQTTFSNSTVITIPASGTGNANPASPATSYPSNVTVSAMSGSITKLNFTFTYTIADFEMQKNMSTVKIHVQ